MEIVLQPRELQEHFEHKISTGRPICPQPGFTRRKRHGDNEAFICSYFLGVTMHCRVLCDDAPNADRRSEQCDREENYCFPGLHQKRGECEGQDRRNGRYVVRLKMIEYC